MALIRFLNRMPAAQRRPMLLSVVLLVIVLLLFAVMYTVLMVSSGVRAYTAGESMWSKSQKDAVHYLSRYSETGARRYWARYQKHITVPVFDRVGRLAMDNGEGYDAAAEAFRTSKHPPADIPMLIFLYQWFAWEPHFAQAVEIWRKGDEYILQIQDIAAAIHGEIQSGSPDAARIRELQARLAELDGLLRPLEDRFSLVLGNAARFVQNALLAAMLAVALLLVAAGTWIMRRISVYGFETERRFRATFEQAAVGISHISLEGRWLSVNERMCQILGYEREQLVGMYFTELTHTDDLDGGFDDMRRMLQNGMGRLNVQKRYMRADGRTIWANVHITLVRDINEQPLYFLAVVEDITDARRLSEELSHQARHDPLTGLINRYEFEKRLSQAVERSIVEGVEHTLCFLDLDQFKIINDTCGHMAGDAMLQQIAGLIRSCIRSNDTLARLGGDEFGLLLEVCTADTARLVADKIHAAVSRYRFNWEGKPFSLGVSIGVVPFGSEQRDINQLLSAADTACYAAKEGGRNRVHVAEHGDPEITRHRAEMQWHSRLRDALEENRFFLVWQPIVPLRQDVASHAGYYEILLRLRDEDGRIQAPGSFLPAAERFGIVRDIDQWVLHKTLQWLSSADKARWPQRISLNVSGVSFSDPGFKRQARELIEKHGVDPKLLCFELTETAAITSLASAQHFMNELHALGCRFALDDFGMGLSSFAYLNTLPVDYVKIDGIFVRDMDSDPVHAAIVRSINEIAQAIGKQTVAEFVENAATLELLREIGVDYAQGYGIGRPVPLGDFDLKTG